MVEYARFPGSIGFPLATKRRYNSLAVNGLRAVGLANSSGMAFQAKNAPLARPGFVPTCFSPIHDVVSAVLLQGTLYRRLRCRRRPESECDVDIYTIIFLALAVFIFLRLRNVLGQRTGSERPPYDRTARNVVQGAQDNNNVVPIPVAAIDQTPLPPTP